MAARGSVRGSVAEPARGSVWESARGSVYVARVSREAASTGLVRRLVDLVFDGSARRLVAHMLENERLGPRDRAEIRRMLDEDDAKEVEAPRSRKKGGRS